MAPTRTPRRRPLQQLGSLVLFPYAAHSNKVWAELAYETDQKMNDSTLSTPIVLDFDEFMTCLNERARTAQIRQSVTTAKEARGRLVEAANKGFVTLGYTNERPRKIKTITILPEAKETLAGFLPKLRGYGDISFRQQYQGALSLAKRHFVPKGARGPTKEEWIERNIECQEEIKCLKQRAPRRTLSIQVGSHASLGTAAAPSDLGYNLEIRDLRDTLAGNTAGSTAQENIEVQNNTGDGTEVQQLAPEFNLNEGDAAMVAETNPEVVQTSPSTPRAGRSFNWLGTAVNAVHAYLTPQSAPRQGRRVTETRSSPSLLTSPIAFFRASDEGHPAQPPSTTSDEMLVVKQLLNRVNGVVENIQQRANQVEEENIQLRAVMAGLLNQVRAIRGELRATEQELLESNVERDALKAEIQRKNDIIDRIVGSVNSIAGGARL
ncbi:hypothetical protein F5I97DRAFT_1838879 [Phlebopus sp. FC_14]|nr:hypothetical protein F5I97DRAFT_1838879 [Phlebopus sp. FC_14]